LGEDQYLRRLGHVEVLEQVAQVAVPLVVGQGRLARRELFLQAGDGIGGRGGAVADRVGVDVGGGNEGAGGEQEGEGRQRRAGGVSHGLSSTGGSVWRACPRGIFG